MLGPPTTPKHPPAKCKYSGLKKCSKRPGKPAGGNVTTDNGTACLKKTAKRSANDQQTTSKRPTNDQQTTNKRPVNQSTSQPVNQSTSSTIFLPLLSSSFPRRFGEAVSCILLLSSPPRAQLRRGCAAAPLFPTSLPCTVSERLCCSFPSFLLSSSPSVSRAAPTPPPLDNAVFASVLVSQHAVRYLGQRLLHGRPGLTRILRISVQWETQTLVLTCIARRG